MDTIHREHLSNVQLLVSKHLKAHKPARGLHKAHSSGWEIADPDQFGFQVALAALLLQAQVDQLSELPDPEALQQYPVPAAVVESDP